MSALIIPFPGTVLPATSPADPVQFAPKRKAGKVAGDERGNVQPIRAHRRVPKANREQDQDAITVARIARSYAEKAYVYAQTEPNSERHRLALHMAGISDKLPRNNLRIFTTPEDLVVGVWRMWRRVRLANLEWELLDARRIDACQDGRDADARAWSKEQDQAEAVRWALYERLVRIPATRMSDVKTYKLCSSFHRGMGNLPWMRVHKPELASVIDEEVERLTRAKAERATARAAKRKGATA